jgi:hypothetical protein
MQATATVGARTGTPSTYTVANPTSASRYRGPAIAAGAVGVLALALVALAALIAPGAGLWVIAAAPLGMAVAGSAMLARRVVNGGVDHEPPPPGGGVVMTGSISSTVRLDYDAGTAEKRYEPTRLVRALYRLAFQAPFPYRDNEHALEAGLHRRTIAGLLTQHWFGERMVARAFDVRREPDGGHSFVTELVRGTAPINRAHAKDALRALTERFDEAGLPTWQVGWYNPRAIGNLIEQADGSYRIIDLESNLVTPVMPPREAVRALRAGQFPSFDDIDVERLRGYLEANREAIAASLGDVDARRLADATEGYAAAAARWHGGERRWLPRALRVAFLLVDVPSWVRGARSAAQRGERLGRDVTVAGIETWQAEGRLTDAAAARLRETVGEREVAAATRNLGAHLALSIPLRFPLGSIARSTWTLVLRAKAEWRALRGRGSAAEARRIHTLPVALLGAVPGAGAFAYLLAKPFREQRALGAILADQSMRKLPARTYGRLHLGALTTFWARPLDAAPATGTATSRLASATRERATLLRAHLGLLALVGLANAVLLAFAATMFLGFGQHWTLGEPGLINATNALQLLAAGVLGVLVFRRFWSPARSAERSVEESAGVFLWGAVGLGLVVFAFDDFFGVHEAAGAFLASTLPIPIVTNNVDDFVTLGYGLGGLVLLVAFRHEVFALRASSALFIGAVAASAVMLGTDAFGVGPLQWFEFPSQVAAVALFLVTMLIRHRELDAATAAAPAPEAVAVAVEPARIEHRPWAGHGPVRERIAA